jgi:hypothetical protein
MAAKKPEKKWMQKVAKTMDKGALHRELKVPEGKKIPKAKLKKAAKSKDVKLKKEAVLAENFQKRKKKG